MKRWNREDLTLALCVALLPPIWAVFAQRVGITTGAVALICAGVYAAAGNDRKKALPMCLGFLASDAWAVLALFCLSILPLQEDLKLFCVLFVMGGAAVLISTALPKIFYCPAWLCGWAIGLTIMGPMGFGGLGTMPLQIAIAMLVGVLYVGVLLDWVHQKIRGGKGPGQETPD